MLLTNICHKTLANVQANTCEQNCHVKKFAHLGNVWLVVNMMGHFPVLLLIIETKEKLVKNYGFLYVHIIMVC